MKKWIFRLLMIFVVLTAISLFALKVVSGTSDTHKRGLEQAFSQIFRGEAKFGALKSFNLIPQFSIEIDNLEILGMNDKKGLTAESTGIFFGPIDLVTKNRMIEGFYLKNLSVSEGVLTPLSLDLTDASIYPNDDKKTARFSFSGLYGGKALKGQIAMTMTSAVRPKFSFNDTNDMMFTIGGIDITGQFSPYVTNGPLISNLTFTYPDDKSVPACALPIEKSVPLSFFLKDIVGEIEKIKSANGFVKFCLSHK